jgi:hypothetical protein
MSRSQSNVDRAVLACSVWLHVGYVGAVAVAAGLIQLFVAETSLPLALLLVFSGGLLAAACWHRAQAVLDHAEGASAVVDRRTERVRPARRPPADRTRRGVRVVSTSAGGEQEAL